MGSYPKPDHAGWEDEYRAAQARDEVYSGFMSRIQAWSKEAEEIIKQEAEVPKTIV